MDNIKHQQLKSLADVFVSPFLKNGKSHRRIIIVSRDFEARIYVIGEMFKRLEEADREIKIIEADRLPEDFQRGVDYAIDLEYYLDDRRRRAADGFY